MKDIFRKLQAGLSTFISSYLSKTLILSALFLLSALLIFAGRRPYISELNEGDISLSSIYAPYNFTYPGNIDEDQTWALRDKTVREFPPIYDFQPEYWDEKRRILTEFFKELAALSANKEIDETERIERLKKKLGFEIENKIVVTLLNQDASQLQKASLNVLDVLLPKIIVDDAAINKLAKENKEEISIHNKKLNVYARIPSTDLFTKDTLRSVIDKGFVAEGIKKGDVRLALSNILLGVLTPNIAFNKLETEASLKALLDELPIIHEQILIKKNELMIGKGQRVAKTHLLQLEHLTRQEMDRAKGAYLGGIVLLLLIFIIMIAVYLHSYQIKIFAENKNLYLISIIMGMSVFLAKVITISPLTSYFVPVAAAAMLLTILLNADVAFIISIVLGVIAGIIAGNKFDVTVVLIVGGMAGIYFIRGVRRRSQVLEAGLFVGLLKFAVICGIGLLNALSPIVFLKEGMWGGVASGIFSAGIVMVFLPVFETLFKITTNITLLELSDLNHPLLKKMVVNAPGTYHHSLVVGNLAEAASDAIGANSLLARIGAYYHDIGKIGKAEYFSENEASHKNPYEKLTPSMSALIIQSHVKDGLELARKHNMGQSIMDFIAQHHGTSLIYYFYQRALEKTTDAEDLKEEAFRYPGPKPKTKETAIVLLADAVEASSRTLGDPTPSRINGLVQKIINNKFIDNQLDDCDLTLKDLNKIAAAFARILTGIFHSRVEYPEDTRTKVKTKNKKKNQ